MAYTIPRGATLKAGATYRITEIAGADPSPTLKVGDIVPCGVGLPSAVNPDPDGALWFADYQGEGQGYGTLVTGLEELGTARVVPWKDGDPRTHCTHCECCGWLFRTVELAQHRTEAHLGGYEQEQKHLREAARLLARGVELDSNEDSEDELVEQYTEQLTAWLNAEATRQKEVR